VPPEHRRPRRSLHRAPEVAARVDASGFSLYVDVRMNVQSGQIDPLPASGEKIDAPGRSGCQRDRARQGRHEREHDHLLRHLRSSRPFSEARTVCGRLKDGRRAPRARWPGLQRRFPRAGAALLYLLARPHGASTWTSKPHSCKAFRRGGRNFAVRKPADPRAAAIRHLRVRLRQCDDLHLPQFDVIGLIVADLGRAIAFCERLGLQFPETPMRRGHGHVETTLGGGLRFTLDTEDADPFVRS
jgi:hypothetical protein